MSSRDSILPLLVLVVALLAFAQGQQPTQPYFDPSIPSCVACEKDYGKLNSCSASWQTFRSLSDAIMNPVGFIDVVKCACGDSFRRVYSLCIECFAKTGQTNTVFNTNVPPSVEDIRSMCQTATGDAVCIYGANWSFLANAGLALLLLLMTT
jgi:hypothetical protein